MENTCDENNRDLGRNSLSSLRKIRMWHKIEWRFSVHFNCRWLSCILLLYRKTTLYISYYLDALEPHCRHSVNIPHPAT